MEAKIENCQINKNSDKRCGQEFLSPRLLAVDKPLCFLITQEFFNGIFKRDVSFKVLGTCLVSNTYCIMAKRQFGSVIWIAFWSTSESQNLDCSEVGINNLSNFKTEFAVLQTKTLTLKLTP